MSKGGRRRGAGRPGWRVNVEDCPRVVASACLGEAIAAGRVLVVCRLPGQELSESVSIARTACGFGGHRSWLVCPACSGKVAALFVLTNRLACRHCHGLAYRSQSPGSLRAAIALLLERTAALGPDYSRPKGMRQRRYLRLLRAAYDAAAPVAAMVDAERARVDAQLQALGLEAMA